MKLRFLLAAALLWPLAGQAQEASAVRTAKDHFQATARMASADVADLAVTDTYLDRRSGATMVYLAQRVNGIEVHGTVTAAAVSPAGRVFASGDAFQSDLAARANAPVPSLTAEAAIAAAEARGLALTRDMVSTRALSDDPASDVIRPVVYHAVGEPSLVYEPTRSGALRLAWSVVLEGSGGPTGQQLWAARVDAQTGNVLAMNDLVAYDAFHGDAFDRHGAAAPANLAPLASQTAPSLGGGLGSYLVIPIPFESPNHGDFTVVDSPSLDGGDASPFGWHDTNGAAGAELTITSGNNANAYTDTDDNDAPDAGSQPDGGADLVFASVFDPALTPQANADASVTNVFYWTNITHDVLWQYGFDEPSGNFQLNNYGRGGNQNDPVNAEALDGSGTNNANFGTPPDGSRPRMQMFEWTGVATFDVLDPADVAGRYPAAGAGFGQTTPGNVTGPGVFVQNSEGENGRGCDAAEIDNDAEISGSVALIQRGDCNFADKIRNVQDLGAIGAVVYNCTPGADGCSTSSPGEGLITMGCPTGESCSDITIAVSFVQQSTGATLDGASATPTISLDIPQSRDSDFDSGVIAHEIGHGVSNRLTGGPGLAGCLSNGNTSNPGEQMGEGWSDYIGIMLTMQAGDTETTPRGVGTYLEFEDTDGGGIRPAVYTTDFAVNGFTYQDVITNGGGSLSRPHGIGFVWASMLWDMTWAMINQDGFGDIYDADGGFGNQKAMQLVIQGLKLQPCSPGFVDGRDAIFAADALLYNSAHTDMIGEVFAARGLGLNADQGSSADENDGTADFTPFPPVAAETDAEGRTTSLVVSGANPFRTATSLTLDVEAAQAVTVDVVDLLGRRVATLFDGEVAAGTSQQIAVSAADLPSGVYLVRAVGETFSLTERVTLTR